MCGILGVVNFEKKEAVEKELLKEATNLIIKRGPDNSGFYFNDHIAFAHNRLAIIDLNEISNQPFFDNSGRYVIIFNGEIYNYRDIKKELNQIDPDIKWKSESDTEVILESYKKWGYSCLDHFRGMFSFAIWDHLKKEIFCARDRLGVKPFFYHLSDDKKRFYFCSRPGPIIKLHPNLQDEKSPQAIRFFLEMGYFPPELSFYKKISKLPPGHFLVLKEDRFDIKRYWDFAQIEVDERLAKIPESKMIDEVEERLLEAIKYRMISDVPVGAFLSGGIDSTIVVSLIKNILKVPIKTFTIGFKEPEHDESKDAEKIASHLKTNHFAEIISANDLSNLKPLFMQQFDEPFFDHSAFSTMAVSRYARKHVTVSLSGDGGDELFGGYQYYNITQQIGFFYRYLSFLKHPLGIFLSSLPKHKLKLLGSALRLNNTSEVFAFARSILKDFNLITNNDFFKGTISARDFFSERRKDFAKGLSPAEESMRLDASFILPEDYLQKVDMASMAFSLEVRSPFLDHKLLEWSATLPLMWKIRENKNKYLLRQLCYRHVPQSIMDRPKRGFGVPMGPWLRTNFKSWATESFSNTPALHKIGISPESINGLWQTHLSGKRDVHPLLWASMMLVEFNKDGSNASIH